MILHHVASRLYGTPKLGIILSALGERIGFAGIISPPFYPQRKAPGTLPSLCDLRLRFEPGMGNILPV